MKITLAGSALALLLAASCASTSAPGTSAPGPSPATHPYENYSWTGTADRAAEDGDGVWTGIFIEGGAADPSLVKTLETQVGRRFAVVMWFADFSTPFPAEDAAKVWATGAVPNITWEPWFWKEQDKIHLKDINDGKYDAYITQWGKDAAAFGKPVMVRWGHEFNGDWYPWSIAKNGQSAKDYVKAYRRVHDLVTRAGAGNVVWVWCPNQANFPPQPWNNPLLAYPGDDAVDWVALDGYDFDGAASFADLFSRIYGETLQKVSKPIYIGETSTGRTGAAKAKWLEDMQASLIAKFPAVKGLVWFNINKERDWRLEGSPEALAGAADVFQAPMFRSRPDAVPELAAIADRQYVANRTAAKTMVQVEHAQLGAPRFGDWSQAKTLTISKGDLGGTVQVAWDDAALHILVTAKDKFPMVNGQDKDGIWNGDCLEFCISTNPAADANRGYFDATDWQMGFTPGDRAKGLPPKTWEWTKLKSPIPGAKITAEPTADGYRLEIAVPWASLRGFKPAAGMKLGFDLAVDDAGASGTRSTQWVWNGNDQFYNSPVQWGTLILGQ
jgi:hypothetical protein